jgi:hypothetical protein
MKKYLLFLFLLVSYQGVKAQNVIVTSASMVDSSAYALTYPTVRWYAGNWQNFMRTWYVRKADTSVFARKTAIPTNTNQLTNGAGFISSFTEVDPTVPSYVKSLTAFSAIKSSTDPLYRPISYVPTWSEVTGKPTIVQQLGLTYSKEYNAEVNTTASTNTYTVTATGISTVLNVQATGFYNGANTQSAPLIAVSGISGNVITLVVAESATNSVLIGGTVEGLTDFLKLGKIFVTVRGS